MRCTAVCKSGQLCRLPGTYDGQCCGHASQAGHEGARAEQARRGSRSNIRLPGEPRTVPLQSSRDVTAAYEKAAALVRSGDVDRGKALAEIAKQAGAFLERDLERKAAKLEELLKERPELARALEAAR